MKNESLYMTLKNKICERIYKGKYEDGENIPSERTLAESLNVSRITVRKALQLLEEDGIVERIQGRGTIVTLRNKGYGGTMDIIALVATTRNLFFATFINCFQKKAESNDSLVLFKQNSPNEKLEDCLFKLFQKNIRNVVLWLEDLKVDIEYIRRLRGLGMNVVFFDIVIPSPYADGVQLDNEDAIKKLYGYLKEKNSRQIVYVGWNDNALSSVYERERVFLELSGDEDALHKIPWKEHKFLSEYTKKLVKQMKLWSRIPDGIICGDGDIGVAMKKALVSQRLSKIEIVAVDDYPEAKSIYKQDLELLAERSYQCLLDQNQSPNSWNASVYFIKGELIKR